MCDDYCLATFFPKQKTTNKSMTEKKNEIKKRKNHVANAPSVCCLLLFAIVAAEVFAVIAAVALHYNNYRNKYARSKIPSINWQRTLKCAALATS